MLKRLIEDGYLNAHKLLLKEQTRLGVSPDEIVILSALITLLEKKKLNVSVQALAKLTNLNTQRTGEVFNHLIERNLVHTELELKSDGKEKEVFSLDPLFTKIEELFKADIQIVNQSKQEKDIQLIIQQIEETFKKSVTPFDLEMIKEWFIEGFTKEEMDKALETCRNHNRKTTNYMDRVLRSKDEFKEEINESKKETIHKLIRGIR
ncbi:DNA replication protein [Acholeplasma morum]|uniref:DnaD domain protein n=1 Tax=Paracholeplasma morum TaxID=264637 RepID=UPI0019563F79|nr:DnaD domain protein [Paracholeplasma morum]MBM7452832.1 DNA replication protein [Paracholeplasma morum]